MRKKSSNILFWVRHIALGLALIVIAAIVITVQDYNVSAPKPQGGEQTKSVAESMTNFYAAHRMSSSKPFEEDIGDFVMSINKDDKPLDDRLKSMESLQKPISQGWQGDHKYRSFRAGSTVREAITTYAQAEGMQVIWELDKDFIIKDQFQLDNTVSGSLAKIARAIDGSFEKEVHAYMCPKQRSLVITDNVSQYLRTNCNRIDSQ